MSIVDVRLPDNQLTNTSPLTGEKVLEVLSNVLPEDRGLIAKHAQELAAVQDRLSALQLERELILEDYADNQKKAADAFNEKLGSVFTYIIEGESTHHFVDFSIFPLDKQVYLKGEQAEAADKLKNLTPFTEVIKTYSENHPVRQQYEKNGFADKPFLQDTLRVEKILSKMVQAVVQEIEKDDPKKAAKISQKIAKQFSIVLMPYQAKAFKLDQALHQNSRSTSMMLAQEDEVRENIQTLSASTRLSPMR